MIFFDSRDPLIWVLYIMFGPVHYWPIPVLFAIGFIFAGFKQKKWLMWVFAFPFILWVLCVIIFIFLAVI